MNTGIDKRVSYLMSALGVSLVDEDGWAAKGGSPEAFRSLGAYDATADMVYINFKRRFSSLDNSPSMTALHELGHWTGHPKRLRRYVCTLLSAGPKTWSQFSAVERETVAVEMQKEEVIAQMTAAKLGYALSLHSGKFLSDQLVAYANRCGQPWMLTCMEVEQAALDAFNYILGRAGLLEKTG